MGAHLVGQPFADRLSEGSTVARQRAQRFGKHLDQALIDRGLQTRLRPEIMSNEPGCDAGRLSDVTHRRPRDAPLGEQSNRGIPQPGTGGQVLYTRRDDALAHARRPRSSAAPRPSAVEVPACSCRIFLSPNGNPSCAERSTGARRRCAAASPVDIHCSVIRMYMILYKCIVENGSLQPGQKGAITRSHAHTVIAYAARRAASTATRG